jgi:urease subunit alpha
MFAGFGQAAAAVSVSFVSKAALQNDIGQSLGLKRRLDACRNVRGVRKQDMVHNNATPQVDVDPQTYEVRADGALLTCEPAEVLPLAQRYMLF